MESHVTLNDPWEAPFAFPLEDTDLWSLVEDDLKHPCIEDDPFEKKPFENIIVKAEQPNSPVPTCEEEEPFSAAWLERKIDLTAFDNVAADVSDGLLYNGTPQNYGPPSANNTLAMEVKPLKGEMASQADELLQEFRMVLQEVAAGLTPPNSPPHYQIQSNGYVPGTLPVAQDAVHLANEMATIDELVRERAEQALVSSPTAVPTLQRQLSFPPTPPLAIPQGPFVCYQDQAVPAAQTSSAFLSDQQPQWIEVTVCHPAGLIIQSPAPPSPEYSLDAQTPPTMTPLSPVVSTVTLPPMEQTSPIAIASTQSVASNSLPPTPATSSASSPPQSPASSVDDSDPDWQPSAEEFLTTKMPSSRRNRPSKCRPYQKQRRQSRSRVPTDNVEEKRLRKKEQNKNAATRYRMKKKAQAEGLTNEEQGLMDRNNSLRGKATDVKREIRYLKGLMRDLFKAKGILK